MSAAGAPSLTAKELGDLVYYARAGDLEALKSTIAELSGAYSSAADQIIDAAIECEADEIESSSGCCLLHWPAANGNEQVLNYLLSLIGSKQCLTEGSEKITPVLVNHKNKSGNTPLHWAAVNGNMSCVKSLIAAGGNPAITNAAGHDALHEADCSGKGGGREVAEWILANCARLEKGPNEKAPGTEPVGEDVGEPGDGIGDEKSGT